MAKRNRKSENADNVAPVGNDDAGANVAAASDAGNTDSGNSEAVGSIDPAAVTAEPASDTEHKPRRGRPPGSGSGTKAKGKPLPINVNGLEKLLVGIHGGVAVLSGRYEWALDTNQKVFDGQTEAEFLASSIKAVTDHYGGDLLNAKQLDWANLIQCLFIVYIGRIMTIRANPKPRSPGKPATVQQTAEMHNPHKPATTPPINEIFPRKPNGHDDPARGHIAGVGDVDLPDSHPLSPNYKPH